MSRRSRILLPVFVLGLVTVPVWAQLVDRTAAPNVANEGIAKSLADQIGAGRGDLQTPDSSAFVIARDPFRAIRRGRQLFQRKFTLEQGQGPRVGDGRGNIDTALAIGAGLSDSCASCHGRPRGSAGFGGDVATRPDSRDAPHLFGLGLKEMLADEITADLRAIRAKTVARALASKQSVSRPLLSKGIHFGRIVARADGSVDSSFVKGVDDDLRVRPFFAHGGTISIREFVVGALQDEMGLQAVDAELDAAARAGARFVTPAGMVLDGALDRLKAPPTANPSADPDGDHVVNEIPAALVDYLEFYLLNYFKPATYGQGESTVRGAALLNRVGCTECHVRDLSIESDRRVGDVETVHQPRRAIFNGLFSTATVLAANVDDGKGLPPLRPARRGSFEVRNLYTDFRRHDVGAGFYERNYDGTLQKEFITPALWGVGSTPPYGHDGRSVNLTEAILRHGGEAKASRDAFAALGEAGRAAVLAFLNSLVLFPPDDTASNLDPGNPNAEGFPQFGHGSIRLGVLFNDPRDPE